MDTRDSIVSCLLLPCRYDRHTNFWGPSPCFLLSKNFMQGSSRLQELRYLIWPDGPVDQLQLLKTACPRLIINPEPVLFSSKRLQKLPEYANGLKPLDGNFAALVSQIDWITATQHHRLDTGRTNFSLIHHFMSIIAITQSFSFLAFEGKKKGLLSWHGGSNTYTVLVDRAGIYVQYSCWGWMMFFMWSQAQSGTCKRPRTYNDSASAY